MEVEDALAEVVVFDEPMNSCSCSLKDARREVRVRVRRGDVAFNKYTKREVSWSGLSQVYEARGKLEWPFTSTRSVR